IGIVGVVLAIVFSNVDLSWRMILLILLVCVIILVALAHSTFELLQKLREAEWRPPRIRTVLKPPKQGKNAPLLCIVEPSDLFYHDALVSIYCTDQFDVEHLIGIGNVVIIQDDGLIQVELILPIETQREVVELLSNNNAGTLQRTKVRPNIPRRYFGALQGGQ
ncbi:MAG: hypothetical protein DMF60_15840, partial [Acidobacteria bacterium]